MQKKVTKTNLVKYILTKGAWVPQKQRLLIAKVNGLK